MDGANKAATAPKTAAEPEWLVITTEYPTEYGCYRGRRWSRAELIVRRSTEIAEGPFKTRTAAVRAAKRLRDRECPHFEDWESQTTFDEEPPWDSSALGNWDNDEEVTIEVLTRTEHEAKTAADKKYLAIQREKAVFDRALKTEMLKRHIQTVGQVHYSHPPQPWDIKADLEAENEQPALVAARMRLAFARSGDSEHTETATLTLSPDLFEKVASRITIEDPSTIKTLVRRLVRVGTCEEIPADDPAKATARSLMFRALSSDSYRALPAAVQELYDSSCVHTLAALTSACPQLEEIHHFGEFWSKAFGHALKAAPHLATGLKLLRLHPALGSEMSPEDLKALKPFKSLEVRKRVSFAQFYTKNASFYQDRLGTNTGRTRKESGFFLYSGWTSQTPSRPSITTSIKNFGSQGRCEKRHFCAIYI